MGVLISRFAQYRSIHFYPGVRLETSRVLPNTDSKIGRNSASPQQPPQRDRSFQAIGLKWDMARRGLFHVRNRPRIALDGFAVGEILMGSLLAVSGRKSREQISPSAISSDAQPGPRCN